MTTRTSPIAPVGIFFLLGIKTRGQLVLGPLPGYVLPVLPELQIVDQVELVVQPVLRVHLLMRLLPHVLLHPGL